MKTIPAIFSALLLQKKRSHSGGNRLKSEFWSGRFFPAISLACLALLLFGCGNKEPIGLSMEELKTQNRAPLEIVSFSSTGGEAVLDILFDDSREAESPEAPTVELAPRRYELTVTNISNRPVTSFHCTITYEDENGQVVTSEDATSGIAWAPAAQWQTIDPGETGQIQILLTAPKNTVPGLPRPGKRAAQRSKAWSGVSRRALRWGG